MHIFWEARCQYAVIYFVVLIPYAFAGYQECVRRLGRFFVQRTDWKMVCKNRAVQALGVLLAGILMIGIWDNIVLNSAIKLGGDGRDYLWMCREWDYWRSDSFTKEGPRDE